MARVAIRTNEQQGASYSTEPWKRLQGRLDRAHGMSLCVLRRCRADLLASRIPVVATVALSDGGLIAEVKRHPGTRLWHVTRSNREALPAEIARAVRGALA